MYVSREGDMSWSPDISEESRNRADQKPNYVEHTYKALAYLLRLRLFVFLYHLLCVFIATQNLVQSNRSSELKSL